MSFPKISIVTPSYNQGIYLEQTVLSVIGQHYPNLEYIVMDGGSSDNSIEILKKYDKDISHWQSGKDNGQAGAINKGFEIATGDILAWLNSDDFYLPGILHFISKILDPSKDEIIIGNCFHFREGTSGSWGSKVPEHFKKEDLRIYDYVIQPSSFWTRKAWEKVGKLDESLQFTFDWDWFIRASAKGIRFREVSNYLSSYRIHNAHKTSVGGKKRIDEIIALYKRNIGVEFSDYGRLVADNLEKIEGFRKNIRKNRLSKLESFLMKIYFPAIFNHPNSENYRHISEMLKGF
jgi:glycosyltransferase involved in cell wall biosynthesis